MGFDELCPSVSLLKCLVNVIIVILSRDFKSGSVKWTHSARPGEGDPSLIGRPLEAGAVSVGEGPVEHHQDVGHVVDAHC